MDFKDINQKIILQTSLFGVFMGIFSVLGWSQNSQPFIWLFTAAVTSFYLYNNNLKNHIFIHCIIIGLSWGFDCALVMVLFFKTYQLNNPLFVNELLNISSYPRTILIATGLLAGIFSGFLIYLPIYILKKLK